MARETRGRGQVISKGKNKWLVKIFLGRNDLGKKQYFSKVVDGNKSKANTYLTSKLRELDTGSFVDSSNQTLNEQLDHWLALIKPRIALQTFQSYESILVTHIKPILGKLKLANIRTSDVQGVYVAMQNRGLSSRTVRYAHAVLSMAMRKAIELNLLVRNPCQFTELPKNTRKERTAFDRDQAARFIKAAALDPCGLIFEFALITGMRPEEYLALQWPDIDFEQRRVSVRRALVWQKGGGFVLGETKTRDSRRNVPLPEPLTRRLKLHRTTQLEHQLKLGAAFCRNDLVFATEIGTPIHYRNLTNRHYNKILEKADWTS